MKTDKNAPKTYYILRFMHDDALHRRGEKMLNARNELRIGHSQDCDIKLPNATTTEDTALAAIVPTPSPSGGNEETLSWRLVRLSPYQQHEIRVNGMPVTHVHRLADGDRIGFEGQRQELQFNIRHDDLYNSQGMVMKSSMPRWTIAMLVAVPVILFAVLFFMMRNANAQLMDDALAESAKESVFKLQADSVWLVAINDGDTVRLQSFSFSNENQTTIGTAFLTEDSMLVTARHCLEPWLNDPVAPTVNDTTELSSLPVRWAMVAETTNQTEGVDKMGLVTFISLWKNGDNERPVAILRSSDFNMNKTRDEIIETGDFDHELYWRSILARHRRTDMTLGDIAWMKVSPWKLGLQKSVIRRATASDMERMLTKTGRKLYFMGFPSSQERSFEKCDDELRQPVRIGENGMPDAVLAHNGDIRPGFSGGPVMVAENGNAIVVGIVSVVDQISDQRKYSVPITEIEREAPSNPPSEGKNGIR